MSAINISPPSEHDTRMARVSSAQFDGLAPGDKAIQVDGQEVVLSSTVMQLLTSILKEQAQGHTIALSVLGEQLTSQEAADLIGVSRPYLIQRIEAGGLRVQMVGTHRRLRVEDVLAFKAKFDQSRDEALRELVEQAQDLRMGYGKGDPQPQWNEDGSLRRTRRS
jgi:excisionase family DNA binding protein